MKRYLLLGLCLALTAYGVDAQNPFITNQYSADPSARVFGDSVYVYPSHDIKGGNGKGRSDWFCMEDYHVFSSADLRHWYDHGMIVSQDKTPWVDTAAYSMWAPDCIFRNGRYYFYFPSRARNGGGFAVGVAVADKPYGPFVPQQQPMEGVHGIDPNVFIDKDGQAYLYWAQGKIYGAKLKDNMLELASEPVVLGELPEKGLKEGPYMIQRNGTYYLTYPHVENKTERLEYAMGSHPLGPFKVTGVIMDEWPDGCWTNHQSIIQFKGQWYLFYHHNDLSPAFDKNRSVRVDSLFFNEDGTIRKVAPTFRGVGLTKAEERIQVDRYSSISDAGVGVDFLDTADRFKGWKLTFEGTNGWVRYNGVDFGEKEWKAIEVRAVSTDGGSIEIIADAIDGPVIGQVVSPAGGIWKDTRVSVSRLKPGIHDLFIRGVQGRVGIDWISFSQKDAAPASSTAQQLPYRDPGLSTLERVKDLISRLTLEEKALLMQDQSPAIPHLGIKKFNWWSEALHGLANNGDVTVFPEPVGMAASFDDGLVYQVFNAVSDEVRAKYNEAQKKGEENRRFLSLSVWTPNINIFRDPRWGRGQETYGEDPYLTSRMGISVVKGLQGPANARYRKLLACAKHFAVHSGPEWSRHQLNLNNIDPRDLWETYLPAFKALVQQADVRQVMCAYQRLDDEPCCGNNRLLQTILRDEWGFKYVIVSDCGAVTDFYTSHKVSSDAVHAAAKAASAGTDVECVWDGYAFKNLPVAVAKGLITEEAINDHLTRVLSGRFDLGEMDDDSLVPWTKIPASIINSPEHRQLALTISRESMTLLQNKDNVLPLSRSDKKIAVIGPNADNEPMLWGNYNGKPVRTITILAGIRSKLSGDRVVYDKACDLVENKVTQSYFGKTIYEGKKGLKATYWNNRDGHGDTVATDRIVNPIKLTTAGDHEFATGVKLIGFSAHYETEFEAAETEEIVFKAGATGHFELLVNGATVVKHDNWRTLPSRIPYKVEKGKKYRIEIKYAQLNNWEANLEFDFGKEVDIDYSGLINKLKGIEVVVFVGGLSTLLEGEEMPVNYPGFKGGDRTNIELPEVQRNCLKALKAAGKKVIFVSCSGSAIAMTPEKESCDAILQAWYGGESGGQAVADVLFGDYNPSGKLPVTFYKNSAQLPDFEDYSMKGRTYRFMSDPLFPFGYGLSYTSFSIGAAAINSSTLAKGDTVTLTIPVSNTGSGKGTEVVQVYVRKPGDEKGPIRTLRGFKRIEVPAGKTATAEIILSYNAFEFYSSDRLETTVTPGEYELWYGNSSDTKDLRMTKIMVK